MSIWRIHNNNRLVYLNYIPSSEWNVGEWMLATRSIELMEAEYDDGCHNDPSQGTNDATSLLERQAIEYIDLNKQEEEYYE